jgi:hypothetical protein
VVVKNFKKRHRTEEEKRVKTLPLWQSGGLMMIDSRVLAPLLIWFNEACKEWLLCNCGAFMIIPM